MNWQHLTYFQTTAELQNFTKAAERLYITSSALSKAIHTLENELGFPLFEKRGRNVTLTVYGKTFLQYVNAATRDLNDGLTAVRRQMGRYTGQISVGAIYTMCAEYLPPRIKTFKTLCPDVTFSIEYQITNNILSGILDGTFDLGFCGDYELDSSEYESVEHTLIRVEKLVIAASRDHWLANVPNVEIRKLAKESFIIYKNVTSGISYQFWPLFRNAGYTPRIAFEVIDDQSLMGMVASGLGIALIPDNPALRAENVITRPLSDRNPTRNQYMVWRKGSFMSDVVSAFRSHVLDAVCESDLVLP